MARKSLRIVPAFLCFVLLISCSGSVAPPDAGAESPAPRGPYLGQEPPGDVPELFAPGVVADIYGEHSSAAFTNDGKDLFWTRQVRFRDEKGRRSRVVVAMHMQMKDGVWTEPDLAPFNEDRWTFITYISPDGDRVYFDRTRPADDGEGFVGGCWYAEKEGGVWGSPTMFTALDEWDMDYSKVQVASSGNIYFQSPYPKPALEHASWGVGFFVSRLEDGSYQEPQLLDESINGKSSLDYGFYVSPDEEFILFSSNRPGGYSDLDLYVSFRGEDGTWGDALNLGEKINAYSPGGSDWPFLSPDGRYLFFMTNPKPDRGLDFQNYSYQELRELQVANLNTGGKIHWVSTDVIDELRRRARRGE